MSGHSGWLELPQAFASPDNLGVRKATSSPDVRKTGRPTAAKGLKMSGKPGGLLRYFQGSCAALQVVERTHYSDHVARGFNLEGRNNRRWAKLVSILLIFCEYLLSATDLQAARPYRGAARRQTPLVTVRKDRSNIAGLRMQCAGQGASLR